MKILKFTQHINETINSYPFKIKEIKYNDYIILYGRNAESNDYLTTKIANDNDLWFHVTGIPGSHVVIKNTKSVFSDDVINKAAEIAVENSKAKNKKMVTVIYCFKKYVTKNDDMSTGQVSVNYKKSKKIIIKNE